MPFDPNPLFYKMCAIYNDGRHKEDHVVICNEGSTRSSKTWDTFHFLYFYCNHNQNKENEIYILRDTLVNAREKTFKDFKKCMKIIEATNIEYKSEGQKPDVRLFGNNIYFRGLEDESAKSDSSQGVEGYPSDILFINEALETTQSKVEGLMMRVRKMIIMDWNPKFTTHWCFNLEGQPNTHFTHSTYRDNKHLPQKNINKIERYSPWMFEDFHLEEKDRRPHLVNIKNQTADEYRWKVYGEGIRAAPEGLIFQYVNYIDRFPDMGYSYGMDFGFTVDPLALVKYAETKTDIYLELLCYEPVENPQSVDIFMHEIGVNKNLPITADSSDKYTGENKGTVEMVVSLRDFGWKITKVSKVRSVMFWLLSMKEKRINIVNNTLVSYARKEQENYRMKVISGVEVNQPDDKFNHFWDASRYAHMAWNVKKGIKSRKR